MVFVCVVRDDRDRLLRVDEIVHVGLHGTQAPQAIQPHFSVHGFVFELQKLLHKSVLVVVPEIVERVLESVVVDGMHSVQAPQEAHVHLSDQELTFTAQEDSHTKVVVRLVIDVPDNVTVVVAGVVDVGSHSSQAPHAFQPHLALQGLVFVPHMLEHIMVVV